MAEHLFFYMFKMGSGVVWPLALEGVIWLWVGEWTISLDISFSVTLFVFVNCLRSY